MTSLNRTAVAIPSLLIVVPTLNSHELLPRLISSLQAQSWPHWQLLFVDGPSKAEHRHWLKHCCNSDPRCRWIPQSADHPGIFGAMNQGFAEVAGSHSWLLFWGSDDWAASANALGEAMAAVERAVATGNEPDLIVCRGRYANLRGQLGRATAFKPSPCSSSAGNCLQLCGRRYRRALWLGSTPPHQATLIGPGARRQRDRYAAGFRLSADLDYFLQLAQWRDLRVEVLDLELVHMAAGGVSGQQTCRRLQEVRRAYRRAFGPMWWFPFLARYARRLASTMERRS